jgi:hypothetical protein
MPAYSPLVMAHFEMGVVGDEVKMYSVAPRVGATGQFQSAVLDDVDAGRELDVRLWLNCRAAAERPGIDDVVALLEAGPFGLGAAARGIRLRQVASGS